MDKLKRHIKSKSVYEENSKQLTLREQKLGRSIDRLEDSQFLELYNSVSEQKLAEMMRKHPPIKLNLGGKKRKRASQRIDKEKLSEMKANELRLGIHKIGK